MPRKKLVTDNWTLPRKDGEVDRFTTYPDAYKAKSKNPDVYDRTADIKFDRP